MYNHHANFQIYFLPITMRKSAYKSVNGYLHISYHDQPRDVKPRKLLGKKYKCIPTYFSCIYLPTAELAMHLAPHIYLPLKDESTWRVNYLMMQIPCQLNPPLHTKNRRARITSSAPHTHIRFNIRAHCSLLSPASPSPVTRNGSFSGCASGRLSVVIISASS